MVIPDPDFHMPPIKATLHGTFSGTLETMYDAVSYIMIINRRKKVPAAKEAAQVFFVFHLCGFFDVFICFTVRLQPCPRSVVPPPTIKSL
jgi:hypothetical protein